MTETETETEPVAEPEPDTVPGPETEPDEPDSDEPGARCTATTTAGGTLYRCSLQDDHDGDHAFQPVDDEEPAAESDEERVRKAVPRLENEAKRHANRILEIMGADATTLEVCPMCEPVIPGYRWNKIPDDDRLQAIRVAIGLPALDNYRPSATERQCDDCAGLGKVRTGSSVPAFETATCDACAGRGFVGSRPRQNTETTEAPAEQPANGTPPAFNDGVERDMFGTPITDPDYGKMPAMRARPIEYWLTNTA